jgi:hypothetical protein
MQLEGKRTNVSVRRASTTTILIATCKGHVREYSWIHLGPLFPEYHLEIAEEMETTERKAANREAAKKNPSGDDE